MKRALFCLLLLGCQSQLERVDGQIAQVQATKQEILAGQYRRAAETRAHAIEFPADVAKQLIDADREVEVKVRAIEAEQVKLLDTRLAELQAQRSTLR